MREIYLRNKEEIIMTKLSVENVTYRYKNSENAAVKEVNCAFANFHFFKDALKVKGNTIVIVVTGTKLAQLCLGQEFIAYQIVIATNCPVVKLRTDSVILHGATSIRF